MDFDETDLGMQLKDKNLFRQQCFIDGKWTDSESGETFEVYNPSNQKLLGYMPNCSKAETIRAIDAANEAWKGWKSLSGKDRSIIIKNT